jgi:acetylglutamate kinase
VPVLASVAPSVAPQGAAAGALGPFHNVNADHAAAPLARALDADALLFLTDVAGLLDGDGALVERVDAGGCARLERAGVLRGGMLPKVESALAAAAAVPTALVKIAPAAGSAAGPGALLEALEQGVGTRFVASVEPSTGPRAGHGPAQDAEGVLHG